MGGLFGIVSQGDCIDDLFYGTDYHSHLGTMRGGLAVKNQNFTRYIHNITNAQFRSKFEDDIKQMSGNQGIGIISDYEDQPLIINSHLGKYAIVTVNKVTNLDALVENAFHSKKTHFAETGQGMTNPTEVIATLISREDSFKAGIQVAQEAIEGSCSMLLLTEEGIYAARDKLGRTPIIIGERKGNKKRSDAYALTSETCAFPNLEFSIKQDLGPGEIVLVTAEGIEQKKAPNKEMQMCSFLWVYYGFPTSTYESINVQNARKRCGAALAKADRKEGFDFSKIDMVAGIPDSGTFHAIGYANESGVEYGMPLVKYTPTWPRSFMPQNQKIRELVAQMKLIPAMESIKGKNLLFCEDSIVRGTQLRDNVEYLFELGAKEVHMRPACPPLSYGCDYLNFSRSRSIMDLAARRAIHELEGLKEGEEPKPELLSEYSNQDTKKYQKMVEWIRDDLHLTSLRFQRLDALVEAIGMPKEKLCAHCWDGNSHF